MNPSTSLGTRSKVGMAKPSPPLRQAGNIGHLLVIRGVCRRSLRSACAHVKYRCRCRDSVVNEAIAFLIQTPVYPLPLTQRFAGFGVYVLYYLGDFEPYDFLAVRNQAECTHPIYVGKAVDRKY